MDTDELIADGLDADHILDLPSPSLVEIAIGEPANVIHAHETVLRSKSPFFAAAFSKGWKEKGEMLVRLPEDRIEIVKLYVQWLYSGKIPFKSTSSPPPLHDCAARSDCSPEYFTLAHLYVFGEKYCDSKFKNAVMDSFAERMNSTIKYSGWCPTGKVVDIIYRGTTKASPARQFMIDAHLRHGDASWVRAPPLDEQNKEFMQDLLAAMYDEAKARRGYESACKMVASRYYEKEDNGE